MKRFRIVYCFLNSKGIIESDENGELIYNFDTNANNSYEALGKLFSEEKFVSIPEILEIKEITL